MFWSLVIFAACALGFGLLARIWPCNRQPALLRRELGQDILYFGLSTLCYGGLALALARLMLTPAFPGRVDQVLAAARAGYGAMARLPIAAQLLVVLLVSDVAQYWLHRAFHGRRLWAFHAIHHSAEQVDWSTTFRIHPLNYLVYDATVAAVTLLMGFSPVVFAILAPFNLIFGGLVHANLNWTYGPFRYVLASPVFHRWHHSLDPEVRDKNFAPTFPVLDLMFGTFHMPEGRLPEGYGAAEVPADFLGQLLHPFRALTARPAAQASPDASGA
jgi:sterol desaturase/sphingolipid hydroxylase (fatty acid hydroxylase superfamily)